MRRSTLLGTSAVIGGALFITFAGACGPATPPVVAPPKASASASAVAKAPEPMKVAPRVCNSRKLIGTLLAEQHDKAVAAEAKKDSAADKEPASKASTDAPDSGGGSFQKAYMTIAPATVIIKAKDGYGSGVIVDKSGLVLTNYHVVAHGMQPDFTIKIVLNFGHKSGAGGMEIDEKTYEGMVVKADRVRDLALIKVKDAPKDVTVAVVSHSDPTPGQPVSAIGHAGIGMLWAMKSCHVAAVGEPARNSFVTARDCGATAELGITDEAELKRIKEQCEKSKAEARNAISEFREGLFIQSDCRVAPGDSGGPLVNPKGEIVGLNQSISADRNSAAGTSYHVHVAELREFISNPPSEPAQVAPDPWCDGGSETEFEDIDMDGKIDGIMATSMEARGLFGPQRFALFIDLNEDTAEHDHAADIAAGRTNMPYDAEVALLSLPKGTFVWYDTNDDGYFDLLLADPEDKGHPVTAFDVARDGKLTKKENFSAPYFFDVRFLPKDENMHTHLGKFASVINKKLASAETLADAKQELPIPDPVAGIGTKGRLGDLDGNGKPDTVVFQSSFARGAAIDADEDSIGTLKPVDDPAPLLKAKRLDAEITYIMQPNTIWVIYDRDNDGKHDLALLANSESDDRIVKQAWSRTGAGAWAPSNDFVGQKAMRPLLVGIPRAMSVATSVFSTFVATDEGFATLPAPMSPRGYYEFAELKKKTDKAVVKGRRGDYALRLFDLDRDTKIGAKDAAMDIVRGGKFDAEVAVASDDDMTWVFYDTDNDKKFDLVLFSQKPETGMTERALRFEDGRLRSDPAMADGKLIRHKGVFKDAKFGPALKKLAADYLPSITIQE
ncbi:MAG: trypsin-like peptidase domain-containing protein [Deltaproteobacteria bacterium]|nr:trypsin-like peptidase domain-containing protein [Deltaproteobacteria bacterium]